MSWRAPIILSYQTYFWPLAIGIPALALAWYLTRSPSGRSNSVKLLIALLFALTFTPTLGYPYTHWVIVSAAWSSFHANTNPYGDLTAALIAAGPIVITTWLLHSLGKSRR